MRSGCPPWELRARTLDFSPWRSASRPEPGHPHTSARAHRQGERVLSPSPSIRQWILLFLAAVLVAGSGTVSPSPEGPVTSHFTIEPPIATPGGPGPSCFQCRGAQGGLRSAPLLAKPSGSSWRRSVLEEVVNRAIGGLGPSAARPAEAPGRPRGTH